MTSQQSEAGIKERAKEINSVDLAQWIFLGFMAVVVFGLAVAAQFSPNIFYQLELAVSFTLAILGFFSNLIHRSGLYKRILEHDRDLAAGIGNAPMSPINPVGWETWKNETRYVGGLDLPACMAGISMFLLLISAAHPLGKSFPFLFQIVVIVLIAGGVVGIISPPRKSQETFEHLSRGRQPR
jgi:hypothetical protein